MIEQLLISLKAYWPIALSVGLCAYVLHNYFNKGLQKYPGDFLAGFSNWWRFYIVYKRRPDITHLALHRKHGDVVRLGPNCLSFASPAAMKQIYGLNKGMVKVRLFQISERAMLTVFSPVSTQVRPFFIAS